MIQLDHANLAVCYSFQFLQNFRKLIQIHTFIGCRICILKSSLLEISLEHFRNIRNPSFILKVRSILDLKPFRRILRQWIESNSDAIAMEVIIHDLYAGNRCHQSCDSLLAINQDMFPISHMSIFRFDVRILPCNDIASRISIIQRINQITNLASSPNKRTLYFRNHKLSRFNQSQNGTNRILHQSEFFTDHEYFPRKQSFIQYRVLPIQYRIPIFPRSFHPSAASIASSSTPAYFSRTHLGSRIFISPVN